MPVTSRDIQDIIIQGMDKRLAEKMTVVSELGEWNGMDAYFVVEAALETEYSCMMPVKKLSDSVYRAIDEMLSDGLIVHGEYESHFKFADIQTIADRALDKNQFA